MMRLGHQAAAAPIAVSVTWTLNATGLAPMAVAVGVGALIEVSCTWNDYDHPRFKGRMHPGAALARGFARLAYKIRTPLDKEREDLHRGPTHCLEAAVLTGMVVAWLASLVPPVAPWAIWCGLAVALGMASHVVADSWTPSGVPVSAIYNYWRYGEVWRRYSRALFVTDSGQEHFLAVPALWVATGVLGLAMLGLLGPVLALLIGL